jgi:3-oxoacyl-[acyl-carrier protein] reductase
VPAQLVEQTVRAFGGLHIVVANAGGPPPGRSLDLDDDALFKAVNDNFVTSARLVRAAVPHMRSAGWGRVCCITSSSIKEPIPTLSASNTARTALWAWAKTAASDLSANAITLNLICPGLHDTDRMRQLGFTGEGVRAGSAADFGKAVAFLCSEPAGYITGSTLLVDGGAAHGLV